MKPLDLRQLTLVTFLALAGCSTATQSPPTTDSRGLAQVAHPVWSRDDVIYEINVRQYTPEGTFRALQSHLPRLRDMGIDILWLMPIQPIGKENRKGGLGSPYSIADYRAINPEYGTAADVKAFVDAAHGLGMRVLLDWVGNHTAFDHPWVSAHRDWYTLRPDGSISFPRDNEGKETDWTDVADLNFDNADMRLAMIADMKWWLDEMDIDGFRADVAWGIPYDFWAQARTELLKSEPDLFMLAEAEDPRLHEWFDMTYAWEFHHLLNEIARGKKPVTALDAYFAKQDSLYPVDAYRMTFTSNHDENSWQGTEFERMGANHLPAFIVAATAERSFPLLYSGQEAGLNKRLRFFEKDTIAWNQLPFAQFYQAMFELKATQPALRNGALGGEQVALAHDGGDRVYAYTRTAGANTVAVFVNFGDAAREVTYNGLARTGRYRDWFDRSTISLDASGKVMVPANSFRILVIGR
jgi:glycosidase